MSKRRPSQRQRIGGIAFEHLDHYRAAVGRAHQADDNLRPVTTVVAAVAMLRQFTAASFEIGGGDFVEQQRAILQVTASDVAAYNLAARVGQLFGVSL